MKPVNSLINMNTLPTNKDITERRRTLQNEHIGKQKSTFLIKLAKEVVETWENQDVPVQDWRVIYKKLQRNAYSENKSLFDCLPTKPSWKSNEDKRYYYNQKNNLGGYCTSKEVSYDIHPSKQSRRSGKIMEPSLINEPENDVVEDYDSLGQEDSDSNYQQPHQLRSTGDVHFADLLRDRANLSISQTISVMVFYKETFPDLQTLPSPPNRGHLSRISRKICTKISNAVQISAGNQTLFFDMKQYQNLYAQKREMICVCIGDKLVEFKELSNKKARTIAECLLPIIEKSCINRVVSDTEPTNTGYKNGVIAHINKIFPHIQYEPCRLHVLDLILKHQMRHFLGNLQTTGPNIQYSFVITLQNQWTAYRNTYLGIERSPVSSFPDLPKNEERRDDYRFLLELVKAIRTLREIGVRPYVKIPINPTSVSSARWNSKAIYALMAELVLESTDSDMLDLNDFISYQWAPVWFGVRDVTDWGKLSNLGINAQKVILKHGFLNKVEYKPPTNEFPERVFRLVNEKIPRCKSVPSLRDAVIRYVNTSNKLN